MSTQHDLRGAVAMVCQALRRRAEECPVLGDMANELEASAMETLGALTEAREAQAECERLRAEIESRYTVDEVASWLFEYRGSYRKKTLRAWVDEKRAALRGE